MDKTPTAVVPRSPEADAAGAALRPGRAALAALTKPGRGSGLGVTAAPGIGLVGGAARSALPPALAAAGVAALAGLAWRLARHQGLWQSLAGLAVAGACAA